MSIHRPLIISAIMIVAMAALSAAAALALPAIVPLRFDAHGMPAAYGSIYLPLGLMPVVALILSAMFAALARAEPRRSNLAASALAHTTRWIGVLGVLAVIHVWIVYALIASARGATPVDPTRAIFFLAGVLMVVIGGQLKTVRGNHLVGVRTPWTLSSERVWAKTQRRARWPVMITGAAIALAALAAPGALLPTITLTIVGAVAAGLIVLSYALWRAEEGRR